MLETHKEFHPIRIPQRRFVAVQGAGAGYKVYKNKEEFDVVEAETVTEAMEKSGVEEPYKVVRMCGVTDSVIEGSSLEAIDEEADAEEEPVEADS